MSSFLPKKPSFHRRAIWHDYHEPATYMITMTKEESTPVLSIVKNVGDLNSPSPQVDLTEAGVVVVNALAKMSRMQPLIKIVRNIIMPDHIHVLLQAIDRLPKPLGSYIGAMAGDCTRQLRERLMADVHDQSLLFRMKDGKPFFTKGFNDRVIKRPGQLTTTIKYILDNPRRLMMKKIFPQFFRQSCEIEIDNRRFSAFGNLYLLKSPSMSAVRYSSKFAEGEFERRKRQWLEIARGKGVLVSPFIHPREKEVREEALELGGKIIALKNNGFGDRYKPHGRDFDLCAQGRLLEIAPLEFHSERYDIRRYQALKMNEWASMIASLPPGVKMVVKGGRPLRS